MKSARPKILLDARAARAPMTGVGWSMVELVGALSGQGGERDWFLATADPDLFPQVSNRPDWTIVEVRPRGPAFISRVIDSQITLPNLAKSLGVDLLHSLTIPPPWRAPCPVVATVHDIAYHHYPHTVPYLRRQWYRLALPRGIAAAARVVTNSETTAHEVREHFQVDADKVVTTPFGTPTWVLNRPDSGPPPQNSPFLFVGALEPRKNLLNLLKAVRILHAEHEAGDQPVSGPILRVVGAAGWQNKEILASLRTMSEEGLVCLEKHCDRDELWKILISARGLLIPSLHEGFGFPILEAMAAGRPVLTSDRGAMKEISGNAALRVNPEDPQDIARGMSRLWHDQELVKSLVKSGYDQYRQWSWERTAVATIQVYDDVIAESRRS